jgi:hypothetical protein
MFRRIGGSDLRAERENAKESGNHSAANETDTHRKRKKSGENGSVEAWQTYARAARQGDPIMKYHKLNRAKQPGELRTIHSL